MDVLVIDIGGTQVKVCVRHSEPRRFRSGAGLTAQALVEKVLDTAADWPYEAISMGFPGVVGDGAPAAEPGNLGSGWVGFDFEQALGKPVRLVNDAVLQALGVIFNKGSVIALPADVTKATAWPRRCRRWASLTSAPSGSAMRRTIWRSCAPAAWRSRSPMPWIRSSRWRTS